MRAAKIVLAFKCIQNGRSRAKMQKRKRRARRVRKNKKCDWPVNASKMIKKNKIGKNAEKNKNELHFYFAEKSGLAFKCP